MKNNKRLIANIVEIAVGIVLTVCGYTGMIDEYWGGMGTALVIIGGIFAVIPLTGITLPIISYGGSSILTTFFALGILQKISEEA